MKTHNLQILSHRRLLSLLLLVIVVATWGTQVAESAERQRRRADFPNVNVVRDVTYKHVDGRDLKLDIYSPKSITDPLPVVLWMHGHRWSRGSKEQHPPFNLMSHGYIVVSIDYRLSGDAPFPAAIEDCKAAVRWIRANATTYHFDPDHIGAWGHSAGGHLAALLGTSGGVAELEGAGDNSIYSSRVQAVCDMSAPSDLLQFYEAISSSNDDSGQRAKSSIEQFLGGPVEQNRAKAIAASPVTYVSKDDAAFLIIHGENDSSIPVSQAEEFYNKLKAAGVDATLEIPKRGHGVGAPQYASEITAFFAKHLKTTTSP